MLKILLNGCNGRMGRVISAIASESENIEIAAGCDKITPSDTGYPVYENISDCTCPVDAVIDFSHPLAFTEVTQFCLNRKIPLVMATTGLSEQQVNKLSQTALEIPVFFSANMSMGVNLLIELAKTAASFTEGIFDIEIIEKHHNKKLDSPSGTALAIASEINKTLKKPKALVYDRSSYRQERSDNEMGILSVRGGTIVGEHSVILAGRDEVIEIKHEAMSRDIFASGALKAAEFLKGRPNGLYSMRDIINSK